MIDENALVVYKNKPAIVKDRGGGKITICLQDGEQIKVRDKDIELIHPGPVKDFSGIKTGNAETAANHDAACREAWELLLTDEGEPVSLKELAGLISGEYTPASGYAAYLVLTDGLYFSGSIAAITPRPKEEVTAGEAKRAEKLRESGDRSQFLERLKISLASRGEKPLQSEDGRFLQDVQALAYGRTVKSRTMKEMGLAETPEDAHALLLNTGFWKPSVNPYPARFGISLSQANAGIPALPDEDRRDLCALAAFAIDSPWSNDPDDAVSIELTEEGKSVLYVHIADPAASITFDSPAEKEARDRGATLYIPEGSVRMLADEAVPLFALGLCEKSPALTFKMTLGANSEIIDTDIFPSMVKVRRITYEEADKLMDGADTSDAKTLCALQDMAERNFKRRTAAGAVNIELPEVHISIENGEPKIEPVALFRSASLVRECMLIAGEGASLWASVKGLAFPYISQEVELQDGVPPGMAGSYQLRRCMRPRTLSTKPGRHEGLGLETYTQVTSPLRRYTDLLAHLQIRAFLSGGEPLTPDEVSARLGAGEAAAIETSQAERASRNHWTMVYLCNKKDSSWEAVTLEKKGNRWAVVLPSLALETQVPLQKDVLPNEKIQLILKSANIPRGEAVFVAG